MPKLISGFFALFLCVSSLSATITITSLTPSVASPQPIGTPIQWSAVATDTHLGPLTFQFSVASETGAYSVVRDFYPGASNSRTWTAPAFTWQTIAGEGSYRVQVIARDFSSGESATTSAAFVLNPLSSGGVFVVSPTANPLVALASAPPCPAWSSIRISIKQLSANSTTNSNFQPCNPLVTSNIYAAGMLPSTAYAINYEVQTGAKITPGPSPVTFTTGALPSNLTLPTFSTAVAPGSQADQADPIVLHALLPFAGNLLPVATDREGNILWYYDAVDPTQTDLLTRALPGGNMLTLQMGSPWGSTILAEGQYLREIDLSGNTVRETNLGVIEQQLLAKGADFEPCSAVLLPASVGAACMGSMHHDAIRLPNGDTAVIASIEKIFPPGTQGDTTGENVDIIGGAIIVLDRNFQVIWSFDTFQHDGGASQLDINRPAVLGETCAISQPGCPALSLADTPGVTILANDWLHQNSLYYDPVSGDILFSARHQDWVMEVDYRDGNGTGNILWRLGAGGDFTFNNLYNDPYPWFSHQHDAEFADPVTGLMTLFDNGNTRNAPPPLGLGGGNSSGMALTIDTVHMRVTPVLKQDLGYFAPALGSAQLLANGSYFFQPGVTAPTESSYAIEVLPAAGTDNGTLIYSLQAVGLESYRSWLMPSLYSSPAPPAALPQICKQSCSTAF